MSPRIELVYDSDCPNVDAAREALRRALREMDLPEQWVEREWGADPENEHDIPDRGSPTILVDGSDVSASDSRQTSGSSCRLYSDDSGRTRRVPPSQDIRKALRAALGSASASRSAGTNSEDHAPKRRSTTLWSLGALGTASSGVGASLASAVAAACCVGPVAAPLVISVLGAGGAAWAAGLKPYSPYILALAGLMLGTGFWSVYRSGAACAVPRGAGRGPWVHRLVKGVLWAATLVWLVSVALNIFLPS